jgi:hypothetical protein
MKKISLSVIIFFLMQLIISCASSQEAASYSYEKIDEERQNTITEIWTYRYSLTDGPWEEIKIYVSIDKMTYIINVGTYPGISFDARAGYKEYSYVYDSMKHQQNFVNKNRVEQGSVNSLEEAVETALSWYIEDNNERKQ